MEAPGMRRVLRAAWDQLAHAAIPPRTRTQAQPARMYLAHHTPAALPRGAVPSPSPSPSPSSLPAARALLAWGGWRISGEGSGQVEARGAVAGRAVAGGGSAEGCGVGHDVRWRGVRQGGDDEAWARSRQWGMGGGAAMDAHVVQCTTAPTSTLPSLYLCVQAPASRPSSWLPPRLLAVIPAPWQELLEHPRTALHRVAWQYRDAAALQVEAFWRNHSLLLLSAGGVSLSLLLWGCSFRLASLFLTMPPNSLGLPYLLASCTAVVALGGAVRAHTSMSPAAAYRMAMCALNTHAGVLEVLGAPLLGAPVRAYVQGGGGIVLSGMAVRAAPRDCWLVFPVRGAEGRGVVQVHVHRHNGQYDLRLVAVDVAAGSAGSECVVVVGDHAALTRAQPLLQGLRHALDNVEGGRAGAEKRSVENAQQEQG
ncbi:unnamed protein product [Closterium sp. Naga37s-1]|nr:unnamed protein product [Closterium sp. Naga37s-1]